MPRIISFAFLLGLCSIAMAQRPLVFSVHADPQFSWFSSDEAGVKPDGSILHIQTGLYVDRYFDRNYAICLGVGFNNLGGRLYYNDSITFVSRGDTLGLHPGQSVRHHMQYIDLPIGLKLKTEELGYATFFLQLGFNPMIRTNAYATTSDESLNHQNISDSVPLFQLGYHVGAGIEYRLGGNTALVGGVRWSSGLNDVTQGDQANVNINALSIHAGILF